MGWTRYNGDMKAIFEYDMNDPDDMDRFDTMYHAQDYKGALEGIRETLRTERKYGENRWESFEKEFFEILSDINI